MYQFLYRILIRCDQLQIQTKLKLQHQINQADTPQSSTARDQNPRHMHGVARRKENKVPDTVIDLTKFIINFHMKVFFPTPHPLVFVSVTLTIVASGF